MEKVNLKSTDRYLSQYVSLRNGYADLLLTNAVSVDETRDWLKKDDIEVWGLAQGDILEGAVILYLNKAGEVAFFSRRKGTGVGAGLLRLIIDVAAARGMGEIWAWIRKDNEPARRAFEKTGFEMTGTEEREYNGALLEGVRFSKPISAGEATEYDNQQK